MGRITVRRPVTRVVLDEQGARATRQPDLLIAEEPLEIRLGGESLTVTMRTPGEDVHLAHGFLLSEGIIGGADEVVTARYCAGAVVDDESGVSQNTYNVLDVQLAPGVPMPIGALRNFTTTASCAVCGAASIAELEHQTHWPVADDPVALNPQVLVGLPELLREHQQAFDRTGALHAAGLFTADGRLLRAAEDVGRHNAVDKVLGWALLQRLLPARGHVLVLSGRVGFELVQKALMAGVPAVVAVSAPSSLAVEMADSAGMTLLGFTRPPSFNVYSGAHRLGL